MRSNNLASGLRTDALHVAAGKVCDTPRRRQGDRAAEWARQPIGGCGRSPVRPLPARTLRAARLTASTTRPISMRNATSISRDGCAPTEIAYVGDRLDNDIPPALAAGMIAVFVRRGPWGWIDAPTPVSPGRTSASNRSMSSPSAWPAP